jgi:hypothetical protein
MGSLQVDFKFMLHIHKLLGFLLAHAFTISNIVHMEE